MVDGKFRVESGSNFSKAIYNELGLTTQQGNKIWSDIFSVAKAEGFGDVNKVRAGQEFELSEAGLDQLIKVAKEKLGIDITKTEKVEKEVEEGKSPSNVRTQKEMESTTSLYLQAENTIQRLEALDIIKTDGSFYLERLINSITKENLAYILKKEPEFFSKLEKKIGEDTINEVLKTLMKKFEKQLPTPLDPTKATKENFMEIIMDIAKENPANEEVSDADKQARKNEDERLTKEYLEKLRQEVIANDKKHLNLNITTPASKREVQVNTAKTKANGIKESFCKDPETFEKYDARTLAYLLTDNEDAKNAVIEGLSIKEKRELIAKLKGADFAKKIDRNNIDNALENAVASYVTNDEATINREKNPKTPAMINDATNLLAEFKNLPPELRGEYENKWGGKTYYNKETGKCVIIKKEDNNIISIEVGRSYNPQTKKYVPETKFEKGKISVNADGKAANYEQTLKFKDTNYFDKLQKYTKEF